MFNCVALGMSSILPIGRGAGSSTNQPPHIPFGQHGTVSDVCTAFSEHVSYALHQLNDCHGRIHQGIY